MIHGYTIIGIAVPGIDPVTSLHLKVLDRAVAVTGTLRWGTLPNVQLTSA